MVFLLWTNVNTRTRYSGGTPLSAGVATVQFTYNYSSIHGVSEKESDIVTSNHRRMKRKIPPSYYVILYVFYTVYFILRVYFCYYCHCLIIYFT